MLVILVGVIQHVCVCVYKGDAFRMLSYSQTLNKNIHLSNPLSHIVSKPFHVFVVWHDIASVLAFYIPEVWYYYLNFQLQTIVIYTSETWITSNLVAHLMWSFERNFLHTLEVSYLKNDKMLGCCCPINVSQRCSFGPVSYCFREMKFFTYVFILRWMMRKVKWERNAKFL